MVTLIHDCVVDVSQNNYTLMIDKHKQDKEGKPLYETLGYYHTLTGAVNGAKDYFIKKRLSADTYTLDKAIEVIKQVNKEFIDLLKTVDQAS